MPSATPRHGPLPHVSPRLTMQVSPAAVLWGAGTALGEIPPYAFSYHAAKAGIRNEEIDRMFGSQQAQGSGAGFIGGFVNGMKAWMMKFIQTCGLQRFVACQCMGACSALGLSRRVAFCMPPAVHLPGAGQHESCLQGGNSGPAGLQTSLLAGAVQGRGPVGEPSDTVLVGPGCKLHAAALLANMP